MPWLALYSSATPLLLPALGSPWKAMLGAAAAQSMMLAGGIWAAALRILGQLRLVEK